MEAGVLACLPDFALYSNYHCDWRSRLDRSVNVATPYAKYVVAMGQQRNVHRVDGARDFLGLSNEGIAMVRIRVRTDSALDAVLGGLHSGHGTHWRLALRLPKLFLQRREFWTKRPKCLVSQIIGNWPTTQRLAALTLICPAARFIVLPYRGEVH